MQHLKRPHLAPFTVISVFIESDEVRYTQKLLLQLTGNSMQSDQPQYVFLYPYTIIAMTSWSDGNNDSMIQRTEFQMEKKIWTGL